MYDSIISPRDLFNHLDDEWVIVDVRFDLAQTSAGKRWYQESHIPGAFYAHLDDDLSGEIIPGKTGRHPLPDLEDFTELVNTWGVEPGIQVVVYDQSHGGLAARLWWMLKWLGHDQVAVLDGGFAAWQSAGFPVADTLPEKRRGHFTPSVHDDWTVEADDVEKLRLDPAWRLVDSRAANRYAGIEEPIDPVAGHIAGALNRPFLENVDAEGRWKDKAVIAQAMGEMLGNVDAAHTVFYCGSGVTACHNILAHVYAGKGMPRLYPGSWSEWLHRLSHTPD